MTAIVNSSLSKNSINFLSFSKGEVKKKIKFENPIVFYCLSSADLRMSSPRTILHRSSVATQML